MTQATCNDSEAMHCITSAIYQKIF